MNKLYDIDLYDIDGIDGPWEKAMAKPLNLKRLATDLMHAEGKRLSKPEREDSFEHAVQTALTAILDVVALSAGRILPGPDRLPLRHETAARARDDGEAMSVLLPGTASVMAAQWMKTADPVRLRYVSRTIAAICHSPTCRARLWSIVVVDRRGKVRRWVGCLACDSADAEKTLNPKKE